MLHCEQNPSRPRRTQPPRPVSTALAMAMTVLLTGLVPADPVGATIPPSRCVAVTSTTDLGSDDAYGMGIDPRNGDLYVTVSGAGRVDVLDGSTHAVIDSITVPHLTLDFVVVDPDHDTLYVSSFGGDAVYAISIATEAVLATIAVPNAQGLALNTTTDRLYAAGQTTTVTEINTATRSATGTLTVGGHSLGVAVDTAGDRVFVGDYTNDTLDVFDGDTNAFIDSHPLPGADPITVAFDPRTGSVWATTRSPGHVSEIDPATGTVGVSFSLPSAQGLALDPARGHAYVTASGAAVLWAFNLLDGSQIDTFTVGANALVTTSSTTPLRIYASGLDDGTVTRISAIAGPFPDVPGDHPFCFDIDWLSRADITGGYPDGTFRPTSTVTRQSMAAFLYRDAGSPPFLPPLVPTFPDVGVTHPFYEEIEWLADTGITGGYPDGTFRPTSTVTRQSMAAFLHRTDMLGL